MMKKNELAIGTMARQKIQEDGLNF